LQQRVQGRLTVREGDTLDRGGQRRLSEDLQQIDEHLGLTANIPFSETYDPQRSNVILRIVLQSQGTRQLSAPVVVAAVGAGGTAPVVISRVNPEYTEEARRAKWQGTVQLQVLVDENGAPQEIKIVRPLGLGLDQKAIEAVQQWRFKPVLLNGQPTKVQTMVTLNFVL